MFYTWADGAACVSCATHHFTRELSYGFCKLQPLDLSASVTLIVMIPATTRILTWQAAVAQYDKEGRCNPGHHGAFIPLWAALQADIL